MTGHSCCKNAIVFIDDISHAATARKTWGSNKPTLRLLRFHPFIRACHLDRHIRNKDVQRLAVGGAAMLG